jgi:hypothetical protein
MVPLLSRDPARTGTVTCAMAHAAGALRALPGRVDGSTAAAGALAEAAGTPADAAGTLADPAEAEVPAPGQSHE